MGMPAVAPALVQLGVPMLCAHLFALNQQMLGQGNTGGVGVATGAVLPGVWLPAAFLVSDWFAHLSRAELRLVAPAVPVLTPRGRPAAAFSSRHPEVPA